MRFEVVVSDGRRYRLRGTDAAYVEAVFWDLNARLGYSAAVTITLQPCPCANGRSA